MPATGTNTSSRLKASSRSEMRAPRRRRREGRLRDYLLEGYPWDLSSASTRRICCSGSSMSGMLAAPRWPPPP